MITRRRVRLVVLALVLFGVGTVAWTLAGLPPVKSCVRYGLDPYCEPTGEKVTLEGVEFVEIGPGIFRMGSTYLAEGGDWLGKICAPLGLPWGKHPRPSDEMPVHWVEFRRGFWIATTEVTNAQFERFRTNHERSEYSTGDDTPVVEVSWYDTKDYCSWLADRSNRQVRLPSEAEWECACRAGSDERFAFGDDRASLPEYAWHDDNWESTPRVVGTKRPNRWDLHDLHGNAWEWCEDTWHIYGEPPPRDGEPSPYHIQPRVIRGGGFDTVADDCRSATRGKIHPKTLNRGLGFRPAFSN